MRSEISQSWIRRVKLNFDSLAAPSITGSPRSMLVWPRARPSNPNLVGDGVVAVVMVVVVDGTSTP